MPAGLAATTARREALAVLRAQQRAIPSEDVADRVAPHETDLAAALMARSCAAHWTGPWTRCPPTQRRIVRALLREPAVLRRAQPGAGIPRGSLGPLRGRAVRALRAQLEPSLR